MSGLEAIPEELASDKSIQAYATPLSSAVMAFFNNSRPILNDKTIRRAFVSGVDRNQLPALFNYPISLVDAPLLHGQLGYEPTLTQLGYDPAAANQMLDQAGWTRNESGQRVKNGQPLQLSLSSQDTVQYSKVAQFLQREWAKLGVKLVVHYYSGEDLQSSVISNHDYDILLYGISIGVDPDVFAYWDSSQASISSQGHLNLSEYKSTAVDQALQAARTRSDPAVRIPKYRTLLTNWVQDAPALALYQPDYIYITRGPVFGYQRKADTGVNDRFYNVNQWMVRQQKQTI
jgi:peptide/nickel transport system substrate-binding protein